MTSEMLWDFWDGSLIGYSIALIALWALTFTGVLP